jgi:adenylate cyclase
MAIEIERKFIVNGEFKHLAVKTIPISQTYLSADPDKMIRIRIYGEEAFLTIKSRIRESLFTRNEWEFPISVQEAGELMSLCDSGKIIKTRYMVPWGDHTVVVDVFHDKNEGLILAEVELSSEDEIFEKPDWLGEEVTGNPDYYNVNLTRQ